RGGPDQDAGARLGGKLGGQVGDGQALFAQDLDQALGRAGALGGQHHRGPAGDQVAGVGGDAGDVRPVGLDGVGGDADGGGGAGGERPQLQQGPAGPPEDPLQGPGG